MTDKYMDPSDRETNREKEFDRLISSANSQVNLPSNFSNRVMQKILRLKVERARKGAIFQSGVVAIVSSLAGYGLLVALTKYYGLQDLFIAAWKLIQLPGMLLLSGLVLIFLIMLDGFLSSRRLQNRSNRG